MRVVQWFRSLFGVETTPEPVRAPDYNLPEEWIFEGAEPNNEVVHKLNTGLETVGDHILYRSQDTGRFAGSVTLGDTLWLAKQLTYWIAGGTLLEGHTFNSIRTTCGMQKCVRPDHIVVKYTPSKKAKAPSKSAQPKLEMNKVKGPPEVKLPVKKKLSVVPKDELLSGDRTKCVSAKVFYETEGDAKQVAAYFNTHYRESGERKLYGYKCDWCAGGHLTKQNPKTRPVYKHPGSW